MSRPGLDLQLRRGRELTSSQAWALLGCAVLLATGSWLHSPWLTPPVLAAALVAPGYAVVALAAAAVEYDSGEGLWRTLALRLVASVALWTVLGTLLVVAGLDPVVGVRLVALALAVVGGLAVARTATAAGVPVGSSLVGALRSWRAVLGLRHVVVPVVGGAVLFGALGGAVALSRSGGRAEVSAAGTSAQAPYVALAVAGGTGTLTADPAGRSTVRIQVSGSRLGEASDRGARLELTVDGRLRSSTPVTVPATGSVTVPLSGDWGRCWRRASVRLVGGADASGLTSLLPRPLTLDGPGLAVRSCR